MIAIDTNVLVRYLVADDPEQFQRATALIESETIFVCLTVFLEVEWVLRARYRLSGVAVEDPAALTQALDWAEQGMDFADALHLACSTECEAFASFDHGLARAAAKVGSLTVRAP